MSTKDFKKAVLFISYIQTHLILRLLQFHSQLHNHMKYPHTIISVLHFYDQAHRRLSVCHDTLALADLGWHENENDSKEFIKYMLGVILSCYREFEDRVGFSWKSGAKSTSYDIVKQFASTKIGTFTKQDALIACPSLGSSSVEAALKKLVNDGSIEKLGSGRKTHYVRRD